MGDPRAHGSLVVSVAAQDPEEREVSPLGARARFEGTCSLGSAGRTKSFYVRTAIREYLEDWEDAYAADEAELRDDPTVACSHDSSVRPRVVEAGSGDAAPRAHVPARADGPSGSRAARQGT